MQIPSYQIRNILSSYVNLLSRKNDQTESETTDISLYADRYGVKAEGKRKSVIEKVVGEIIGKISEIDRAESIFPSSWSRSKNKKDPSSRHRCEFAYYKIENDGEKRKFRFRLENEEKGKV